MSKSRLNDSMRRRGWNPQLSGRAFAGADEIRRRQPSLSISTQSELAIDTMSTEYATVSLR